MRHSSAASDDVLLSLARKLGRLLVTHKLILSTAESCTGGLIAKCITDVPGSSRYFSGGVVSYSNDIKEKVLHVDRRLIAAHGAVSEEVARAMARGVQKVMGTDCSVAVTGIAGPDGGSAEKPVGLVYAAVAKGGTVEVKRFVFPGDRDGIRRQTARAAMDMLIRFLR